MLKEIKLFTTEKEYVVCHICAHECKIREDKFGICHAKKNIKGVLYDTNYGIVVAQSNDRIEKKPLFHFLPGSFSYSVASPGCNFRCNGCLNAGISQVYKDENYKLYLDKINSIQETMPDKIIERALRVGAKSISYTYTEPAVFFEYSLDTMEKALREGLKNVFVTNGYLTDMSINILKNYIDAANIDIKFFNDRSYRKMCGGTLSPVLNTIEKMFSFGIHIELTTTIIEGHNDSEEELRNLAKYIAQVSKDIPWHVLRFIPYYKMKDIKETDLSSIKRAYEIGKTHGLNYVYTGNLGEGEHINTVCPSCENTVVERIGLFPKDIKITPEGSCGFCGYRIYGAFNNNNEFSDVLRSNFLGYSDYNFVKP